MSAETDLRDELLAYAPLLALVGGQAKRIAFDKVDQGTARPFVVMVRSDTEDHTTLLGENLAGVITFSIQCWDDRRPGAEALADMVEAALRASTLEPAGIPCLKRSSGYEPDLDLEAVNLTVEWWYGA